MKNTFFTTDAEGLTESMAAMPDTGKNPSVIRLSNKQTGATKGAICASSALDGISFITPYTRIKHSFHSCCQSHVLKY